MNIQERIERHLMSERKVENKDLFDHYEIEYTIQAKGKLLVYLDDENESKKMAENYLKGGIHPSDENTVEKITEKIQVKITKTKGVQGEEE